MDRPASQNQDRGGDQSTDHVVGGVVAVGKNSTDPDSVQSGSGVNQVSGNKNIDPDLVKVSGMVLGRDSPVSSSMDSSMDMVIVKDNVKNNRHVDTDKFVDEASVMPDGKNSVKDSGTDIGKDAVKDNGTDIGKDAVGGHLGNEDKDILETESPEKAERSWVMEKWTEVDRVVGLDSVEEDMMEMCREEGDSVEEDMMKMCRKEGDMMKMCREEGDSVEEDMMEMCRMEGDNVEERDRVDENHEGATLLTPQDIFSQELSEIPSLSLQQVSGIPSTCHLY